MFSLPISPRVVTHAESPHRGQHCATPPGDGTGNPKCTALSWQAKLGRLDRRSLALGNAGRRTT
jgi:hypothetical protein